MSQNQNYLLEIEDGLPVRDSNEYAKDKLRILEAYIFMFITSMRNKNWRAINYIDLQAGPGKNKFKSSGTVSLGSPLIAVTAPHPFSNYWFVELDTNLFDALNQRISVSPRSHSVHTINGDCNVEVDKIAAAIEQIDNQDIAHKWSSLNLAFLDPEGLEMMWSTVERLGSIGRMDLIINFSTSGIIRNARQMIEKGETTKIDEFFGTAEWQSIYENTAKEGSTKIRRALLDFYKQRLEGLGYNNREVVPEMVFKNTRGRQIYTLIFASKHPLGEDFWEKAIARAKQSRLF